MRETNISENGEKASMLKSGSAIIVQCLTRSAIVPTVLNATSLREIAAMSALVVVMACITTEFVCLRFLLDACALCK